MIEERGKVVAVDGDAIWVETVQRSGCHGCAAKSGCGTGLLGDFWASASRVRVQLPPAESQAVQLHDTVVIGIGERVLASSALVVYLVPLVLLVAGALAGQALGSEPLAIAGALLGLIGGALAIRAYSYLRRGNASLEPVYLRREQSNPCAIPVVPVS
ncbi:positive regulator for alginate biosynthesis MucC [Microbulbifer agarilyticus]|uniref:Positive regulator for alginate biosynthesis MucC n=1 Tax=Microbulbifer agarilyticus TaxID=260552 RepID=A0A1Q2M5S0_9GAMM|nr:SoxR reducing system RseC family protein [Microbulbifer agarilyticus]AQQ68031.1 positive regulator for alginate biosynthesis MucC [Microbulbifer agarilyticus]